MSRFQQPSESPHEEDSSKDPVPTEQELSGLDLGEEEADSYSQSEQAVPPSYKQQRRSKKSFIIMLLILIAIGAGGYFLFLGDSEENENDSQTAVTAPEEVTQSTPTIISDETERYRSNQFLLSLDVPTDWEINDDTANNKLTLTSPDVSIPTGSASTSGVVVLTIQAQSEELPGFTAGNAIAVAASEKITYSQASSVQRGQTFLSFLGYAGSSTPGDEIDGIYITGDFGYEKDQAIPEVDIKNVDPIIFVEFFACDGTCDVPLAIPYSAWEDPQFGQKIGNILVSLTIN